MNYNLLDEPWIPVMWKCGKTSQVGIHEALSKAGEIREIAASNPMDRVAILRFLLALLYWCKGNPSDADSVASGDSFPAEWFSKLDDNKDYFNLFDDKLRFYQDRNAKRERASTDLFQEIPTGNNFWHFRHSTDKKDGLCAACAAMGLLRLPLFCVSSLPDLKSGINGAPPIYVVPWGISLLDTLRANWTTRELLGIPAWVNQKAHLASEEEVPLLTGLTLLARRVWLHEPIGPPGACCVCGRTEETLIRMCENQSAGKQENKQWDDPHVVYLNETTQKPVKTIVDGALTEITRKSVKASDLTAAGEFRMDRPWPNLLANMITSDKFAHSTKITFFVVGFATDKAKNIDVWERKIDLPSTVSVLVTSLQQWNKQGWSLGKRIEEITRSEVTGASIIAAIRPHVEGKVSAMTSELLTGDDDAWDRAAREYRPMMKTIAQSLSPGFTAAAVQQRQQIVGVLPVMRSKGNANDKPVRKKGGKK
ncbi:MAG: type I-E CRISPR-associated protein Cse1/CasA [Planctomycetota bacterium]